MKNCYGIYYQTLGPNRDFANRQLDKVTKTLSSWLTLAYEREVSLLTDKLSNIILPIVERNELLRLSQRNSIDEPSQIPQQQVSALYHLHMKQNC